MSYLRSGVDLVARLVGLVAVACVCNACGDEPTGHEQGPSDESTRESEGASDEATLESLAPLVESARAEGFKTWPTSELAGIRVSLEVPPGERRNIYSVRVMFEIESDPTDSTAKSGSVVCSPKCQVIRHKVDAIPHPWPTCTLADAVKAARKSGLKAKQPLVTYGSWGDGPKWTFKEEADAPSSIVIHGESCAPVVAESATAQPDMTITQPAPLPAGSVVAIELDRSRVESLIMELAKIAGAARGKNMRLVRVREGSVLHEIGLRNGDVVMTINGFDFSDPEQAIDAYAKLRRAGQLDIVYERGGSLWTLPVKVGT